VSLPWIGYCPETVAERETASISISQRGSRKRLAKVSNSNSLAKLLPPLSNQAKF